MSAAEGGLRPAARRTNLASAVESLEREMIEGALARADVVVVLDVYPARERAEDHPGVSGLTIAETTASENERAMRSTAGSSSLKKERGSSENSNESRKIKF